MNRLALFLAAAAASSVLAPAGAAKAQAVPNANATGAVEIVSPLSLTKKRDMDFATLVAAGAGTAVIDPFTDSMSTTGGVQFLSGTPRAALFTGAVARTSTVIVRLPRNPVQLTRIGGTETMTLSNFTQDDTNQTRRVQAGTFDFRVGGTLSVAAAQAEGTYVGTFDITLQYP